MTDVSDMGHYEHLLLAEEGAVLAAQQEADYQAFCEDPRLMELPDMTGILQMKLAAMQITLAGAQLHATLALVKVSIAMEARGV